MSFYSALTNRIENDKVNAAKGILILLVVWGHATNFFMPEPFPFLAIKFFHVADFLMLAFVFDIRPLTPALMRDRLIRYYIPYAIFLIGYGLLYLIFIRGIDDMIPWVIDVVQALIFGNGEQIDAASGLRALWFLPAYLTISLTLSLLIGRWRVPILYLLIGAFILNGFIGLVPDTIKYYLPMEFVNVTYLFMIGLLLRLCIHHFSPSHLQRAAPACLGLLILLLFFSYLMGSFIKFPIMILPDFFTPASLFLHNGIIFLSVLFLLSTTWFQNFRGLKFLGRNSLQIYLFHLPFVLLPSVLLRDYWPHSPENLNAWLAVVMLFCGALGIACVFIAMLNKLPIIQRILFPKDWKSWKIYS